MQWKCFFEFGCTLAQTSHYCYKMKLISMREPMIMLFKATKSACHALSAASRPDDITDYVICWPDRLFAFEQRWADCRCPEEEHVRSVFSWQMWSSARVCEEHEKALTSCVIFPIGTRLFIWASSAVRAEAYSSKFLQISSLATVHNQACHFPRNRRVVKITAFEEWKFTHCLFLNRSSNKIAIW